MHYLCNHESIQDENDTKELLDEDIVSDYKLRKSRSVDIVNNDNVYNKFVNEVNDDYEQKRNNNKASNGAMEDIYALLIDHGWTQSEFMLLMKFMKEEQYDTDGIIMDLIDDKDYYNLYINSNIYYKVNQNRYLINEIKQQFNIKPNDNDILPAFQFGVSFYSTKGHDKEVGPEYVSPSSFKYKSLKEETLNNNVYPLEYDMLPHSQLDNQHV